MSNDLSLYKIFRKMGVSRNEINLSTSLQKDLCFDHFDMNIFLFFLESRFDINISEQEVPQLQTVANTLEFVQNKLNNDR